MPAVAIRLLIINRQIKFSTTLKQALEQMGQFDVSPFTSATSALEYLLDKPQHIALVDFTVEDMQGIDIVLQLRAIQPDIAIIASPHNGDVVQIANDLALQGVIDIPISARKLIPLLEQAINEVQDSLPDTVEAPAIYDDSDTMTIAPPPPDGAPEFSSLDSVLVHVGGLSAEIGTETLEVEMDSAGYAVPSQKSNQHSRSIEFVLRGDIAELRDAVDRLDELSADVDESYNLFKQLASEEPPMPNLEENGTVGDLMIGVGDTNLREVVEILKRNQPLPDFLETNTELKLDKSKEPAKQDKEENTARLILGKALDQTTPLNVDLDDLLKDIDSGAISEMSPVKARLSGKTDIGRYVREPDFLPEESRELERSAVNIDMPLWEDDSSEVDDVSDVVETPQTEDYRIVPPPPPGLPERPLVKTPKPKDEDSLDDFFADSEPVSEQSGQEKISETGPIEAHEESEHLTAFGTQPIRDDAPDENDVIDAIEERVVIEESPPQVEADIAEIDITGLALNLTQASVDLTADATILARGGQIIDFAGKLTREDIDDLTDEIDHDWEANPNEARIRFITLRGSGVDYLLYSRRTEDGLTLSLVFTGNMPLRVVRRQYDQLVDALYTFPEVVEEEAVGDAEIAELTEQLEAIEAENTAQTQVVDSSAKTKSPDVDVLTQYTFVWLVRDPEMILVDNVARSIVDDLGTQLTSLGWDVQILQAEEDFVYFIAGIPGEVMAHEIINDLKMRSAQIAREIDPDIDPAFLWADSYLAYVPGRELDVVEIQRFINFARVRG